jgi:5-formyltetrahydrofolate cyclo-ligase
VREACAARAAAREDALPVPRAKKAPTPVRLVAVAARMADDAEARVLVRGRDALFGGLYGLPAREGEGRAAALEALGGPRLGLDAIAAADVILAPALAIDRLGHRLGQGGGCYDRALPRASGEVIAVIADDELVEAVPTEAHDLPVAAVVTPSAGLMRFPRG